MNVKLILFFIVINIINSHSLRSAEHGSLVIKDQFERRTVIQDGKAYTYSALYQAECFVSFWDEDNSFLVGLNSDLYCLIDLNLRVDYTEPCLIDVREIKDLPILGNPTFNCEKKFKASGPYQIYERKKENNKCRKRMSQITGFYSDRIVDCQKEAQKYINYYANQMLLIQAK